MAGPPLQLYATPDVASHAVAALRRHRQLLAREGEPVPAGLDTLEAAFAARADMTDVAAGGRQATAGRHPAGMQLLTYAEAATALGCSTRTVRRRVAAGQLPTTGAGRHRRIPAAAISEEAACQPST